MDCHNYIGRPCFIKIRKEKQTTEKELKSKVPNVEVETIIAGDGDSYYPGWTT